jgi:YedE family putative selenium metabolism protein
VRVIRRLLLYPEEAWALAVTGALFGAVAAALTWLGNPASSGLCASCFLVNVAGSVGLHARAAQSYLRPELMGIALGAFFAAFSSREFRVSGGSSTLLHFIGGAFVLLGCEVFIGCPIKALLRTAGGGLAGLTGLVGLVAGVLLAVGYLRDGFSLSSRRALPEPLGFAVPVAAFALLATAVSGAGQSQPGGTTHAPFAISLAAGLFFGAAGQRSRFCVTGSLRNAALLRDFREGAGTLAFLAAVLAINLATGAFNPTLAFEPGAHTDLMWAFLALAMVGFGATLIAGCPFRQLVRAASGDLDAAAAVAGMLLAAGLSVRLGIGSSPAGVTDAGKLAVLVGWALFLVSAAIKRKAA